MRFRQIDIEHYGIFSGRSLEFSGDGLQVIYGPNEAGKSTLLSLLRQVLFGFGVRNPYVFAEHVGEMAATVELALAGGRRLKFRRRKGRKQEVLGEFLDDRQPLDHSALHAALGQASSELFEHVFAFSLAELTQGQESLAQANVGEALYGGALGRLRGLQQSLRHLQQEHERLYVKSARGKRPLNQLVDRIKSQKTALRGACLLPREYRQLDQAAEQAAAAQSKARGLLIELREEQQLQQRLQEALPVWQQHESLRKQLAELHVPDGFPADGLHQLDQGEKVLAELDDEINTFRAELQGLDAELNQLQLDPQLVARGNEIQQLSQEIEQARGFRRDLPLRRSEAEKLDKQLTERLQRLDPSWGPEQWTGEVDSVAGREALIELAQQGELLEQRWAQWKTRNDEVDDEYRHLSAMLDDDDEQRDVAAIQALAARVTDYRSRETRLVELNESLERLRDRQDRLREQLSTIVGTVDLTRSSAACPAVAVIEDFQTRWGAIEQRRRDVEGRRQQAQADVLQAEQERERAAGGEAPPDQRALQHARQTRDAAWRELRDLWLRTPASAEDALDAQRPLLPDSGLPDSGLPDSGLPDSGLPDSGLPDSGLPDSGLPDSGLPDSGLPDSELDGGQRQACALRVDQGIQLSDEVADAMQAHAQLVARLAQMDVALEQARQRQRLANEHHQQVSEQGELLLAQWNDLWRASTFEPLEPVTMLAWRRQSDDYQDLHDEVVRLECRRDEWHEQQTQFEEQVRRVMLKDDSFARSWLDELQERADELRAARAERHTARKQLKRFATKQQELADQEAELSRCQQDWQQHWQETLQRMKLPSSWSRRQVSRVLDELDEARHERDQARSLWKRVEDMQHGWNAFVEDVARACRDVAADLSDAEPESAARQLSERLAAARRCADVYEKLTRERERTQRRLATKQQQVQRIEDQRRQLETYAGTRDLEQLRQIASAAARCRQLQQAMQQSELTLRGLQGSWAERRWTDALEQASPDALAARLQVLKHDLQAAESEYEQTQKNAIETSRLLSEAESTQQATECQLALEASRSQLRELVNQWAPLVLAESLLKQSVAKFERECQPEMLQLAGQLVRQLTDGRYLQVQRRWDESGLLELVGADGSLKTPDRLSTGTREQLYLAIRLAYIRHYVQDNEPLPVIMDDVLVNFDQHRARRTLEVVNEFAQDYQVLFFTCHEYMVDLTTTVAPDAHQIRLDAPISVEVQPARSAK